MTDNIVSVKPDPLQGKEDHIGVGSGKTNKSERLDRHSGTGRTGAAKKHGSGKGGWGSIEEEIRDGTDPRDPALDDLEEEDEEEGTANVAKGAEPKGKADDVVEQVGGGIPVT